MVAAPFLTFCVVLDWDRSALGDLYTRAFLLPLLVPDVSISRSLPPIHCPAFCFDIRLTVFAERLPKAEDMAVLEGVCKYTSD